MKSIIHIQNYIGGQWVASASERIEEVPNPATGETIALVPHSSKEEVRHAIQAASDAFPLWKNTAVAKRSKILFKYQQLLVEHWDDLAKLITIENGKSYSEAYGEVLRGI